MRPDGDGGFRRSSPLRGSPLFGSQCRLHPPSPSGLPENGDSEDIAGVKIAERLVNSPAVRVLTIGWYISDRNSN